MKIRHCPICGNQLPEQHGRGRPSNYCPPLQGCKYRAYRDRREFRGTTQILPAKQSLDLIFCAGDNRMSEPAKLLV